MTSREFRAEDAATLAEVFTASTGVGCTVLDRRAAVRFPPLPSYPCRFCRLISGVEDHPATSSQSHWRWVEEATRFGGRYIFLCENDFTHWTSPIMVDGKPVGAFVGGPVLTIEEDDFIESRLVPRGLPPARQQTLEQLLGDVPRVDPRRVTALSELLYCIARRVSDASARTLDESSSELERQSRINEYIQERKSRSGYEPNGARAAVYPVEMERRLLDQIRFGDIAKAQKTLNELLGHVFFATGSDIESIRSRTHELVALLSRAVINEGADPEEVFGLNFHFLEALDRQTDINGVAFWMARIARRFADLVLYMPNLPHGTVLRRATRYVRTHMDRTVTVTEVARHVGLSENYFSRVFAAETGERFVSYVRRMRIDRAKEVLRTTNAPVTSIAASLGFADHSYFTKLFRRETGVTPTTYRVSGA